MMCLSILQSLPRVFRKGDQVELEREPKRLELFEPTSLNLLELAILSYNLSAHTTRSPATTNLAFKSLEKSQGADRGMLERTAGCLESGSLRHLVPGSKKSLQSRRALHSGFWTHGATDLELSPLWAALVRGPDHVDSSREVQGQRASSGNAGMLLDFLYPGGTIRLLRQYSGWATDRQDGRRSISGLAKLGHRLYTSSAQDTSGSNDKQGAVAFVSEKMEREQKASPSESLSELLGMTTDRDPDEAWRLYHFKEAEDQRQLRLPLIELLRPSSRIVDAERITELFELLDENDKTPIAYTATIGGHLRLRNLSDAMALNQAALLKFDDSIGVDQILAYMFSNSLWSQVLESWSQFQSFHTEFPRADHNILDRLFKLPKLLPQTLEFANYVTSTIGTPPSVVTDSTIELIDLAERIVNHVLSIVPASEDATLIQLLSLLKAWGKDSALVYNATMLKLLSNHANSTPAVELYRESRREKDIRYSKKVLHKLLDAFCRQFSIEGMQQVLNDFFHFYNRPSRLAYTLCMREFASQGDAETVHSLFEQYVSRFQTIKGDKTGKLGIAADEFAPLLHVHAKRGDLSDVLQIFDSIQETFELKPSMLCWNIVLNAHGKVRDADGALAVFEHLLETTDLQPDAYSFGTLVGICSASGDRERAIEICRLAESLGIEKSATMIDSLVLTYLKDEDFDGAEKICEDSLEVDFKGSRTRMWNYMLVAYALRRDLFNVHRLLQRMSKAQVEYDVYTYAALMQALVMVNQPDEAKVIMERVMKEAGMRPTSFHYAVLMGGYITTGEIHKVFQTQNKMADANIRNSASTRLLTMKAAAVTDLRVLKSGTGEQQADRALQIFQETLSSMEPMDISQPPVKGMNHLPQDIAYSTMFNSFIMFVLSQRGEHDTVSTIYEQYIQALPENRRASPPLQILTPLMISKSREKNYDAVKQCWDVAMSQARKQGQGVPTLGSNDLNNEGPSEARGIMNDYKLVLEEILSQYMFSLVAQQKIDEIPQLVESTLSEGFLLSNDNWNHYVQIMAIAHRYKVAFELCEAILMPGFLGWARLRWQAPERNRLPVPIRNLKKLPKILRPKPHTLLRLARCYLDLQSMAAESPVQQIMLAELERSCPNTIMAIRSMQRTDDEQEAKILEDYIV